MITEINSPRVHLVCGDLPAEALEAARTVGMAALDLETTGLNWASETIATCQVYVPGHGCYLLQKPAHRPTALITLLADSSVNKVFHHAMFDLRFLARHCGIRASNVACTKIASKILKPSRLNHSLKPLLAEHLGVFLDKTEQVSDWSRDTLSAAQIEYAVADVAHLPDLHYKLTTFLDHVRLLHLYHDCLAHLPTRVELEIRGYTDVYLY